MSTPILIRHDNSTGNLGDVLIWKGLVNLMVLKKRDWDFLYVDKFSEKDFAKKLPLIREAGFVIFAGTPQYSCYDDWSFWWDREIYTKYCLPYSIQVFSIAGGSGAVGTIETPAQFTARCRTSVETDRMMKLRAMINPALTVRDAHADMLLKSYDSAHKLLPCTAAWSLMNCTPRQDHLVLGLPGFNHYSPTNNGPSILELIEKFKVIYKLAEQEGYNPVFGCPGMDAGIKFSPFLEGYRHFIPETTLQWQEFLAQASGSISCRIHVSIPMAYFPEKKSILLPIDSRGSAAKIVGIPLASVMDSPEALFKQWKNSVVIDNLTKAQKMYLKLFDQIP